MGDNPVWNAAKPFLNGGLSGMMATCVIQPIDMVKVRLQLGATGSPLGVASNIIKEEGFGALYKGLSAGLLRQATYTTARLGFYNKISNAAIAYNDGQNLPLVAKAGCGLTAGALGAMVGNPADLSLIRMQADGTLPPEQRRGYKNAFDALIRIAKEEGVGGLFAGCGPTVARAMALNMGMLASNDQFKEMFVDYLGYQKTDRTTVVGSACAAGVVAAAFSLPFDFVKTRMQKMQKLPDGTYPYKGSIDCAAKTLAKEGPLVFYTGFPTYCVRIAPHVSFTLVFLEVIQNTQKKMGF
uniref:Solute carrier family 25 (Mitochondrial oxoglutarate transporter), member 11 n=1 Tax=Tetraselmis sp. GSL018 TaxID=582737 RepID=A0A061S2N8_9CHLO|mmetsp:Transcript_31049/g.73812  ORF Transcript_31049/g.73812 Transcript_31049/m.73812 type:complete len:297 (+) Transcript_31049:143-1033(+)